MPKVTKDEIYIIPKGKDRFWTSDDPDSKIIRDRWTSYVNSNKVTFTKNVTILEDGRTRIECKSVWEDQADYNEWENWYDSRVGAKRAAYNEANNIICNKTETIG